MNKDTPFTFLGGRIAKHYEEYCSSDEQWYSSVPFFSVTECQTLIGEMYVSQNGRLALKGFLCEIVLCALCLVHAQLV